MNQLQIFKSPEFGQVRTIAINDEPYFIGKDIAEKLGYSNTRDALLTHIDNEDKADVVIHDGSQNRNMVAINESGLFSLVLGSKLHTAKQFKRWITKDVLPSIRKNGMYATDELLDNPDLLIQVATALKEERERNKLLDAENQRMKPKEIFADAVAASHSSILVGDLAKILKQNGIDIGANRLFEWLRDNGYLIKRKGADWNMPTQYSMNLDLFEVKESTGVNPDGSVRINKTTKVTGKGQQYFINKLLGKE